MQGGLKGRYHNTSIVTDMLHSLEWRTREKRRFRRSKQPCSNKGRQIFTKWHREKTTSLSSDQSRQGLHSLFLLSPDCYTMESTAQSDILGNPARNFKINVAKARYEGRAPQAQLIPKISSIFLPLSLFSSFYLSLFLLICLVFFFSFFPFSHSTGDNP